MEHEHDHVHEHGHGHGHGHGHEPGGQLVSVEARLLAKNDRLAAANRARLRRDGVFAVNLMGGPGAGKTSLLERTLARLGAALPVAVVEGDQATDRDARRIAAAGGRAWQINTGAGCHLDAELVARGLAELAPAAGSLLFVENVGNLVCPALFDLGEACRVVVLSVTEGEDKPTKYPHMFRAADVVVLNKIDLLPHVDFDPAACLARARRLNPHVRMLPLSATRGDGIDAWCEFLHGASLEARS